MMLFLGKWAFAQCIVSRIVLILMHDYVNDAVLGQMSGQRHLLFFAWGWHPKVSKGRPESPLVVPAGTKHPLQQYQEGYFALCGGRPGLCGRPGPSQRIQTNGSKVNDFTLRRQGFLEFPENARGGGKKGEGKALAIVV